MDFLMLMASGIYAIANIGRFKVFVGDVHSIKLVWPGILEMLNSGSYPHIALQQEWLEVSQQRHFTFHTHQEIKHNQDILGIEQLEH